MKITRMGVSLTALIALMSAFFVSPANAVTFTQLDLSASVSGTNVTTTTKVSANPATNATYWGVCARSASNANLDFNRIAGTISTTGSTYTSQPKTFATGTYRYWPCVLVGSTWYNVGAEKTFTVGGTSPSPTPSATPTATVTPSPTPTPTAPTTSAPSDCSATMPTTAPTGFKGARLAQDFNTPAALGQVDDVYGADMAGYSGTKDSKKKGLYAPDKVLSVSNGQLHWDMHTENGQPLVAAPTPLGNGYNKWSGVTYGRYSYCMKTNVANGYKTAFLNWPESQNWNEGEIDWVEMDTLGARPRPASAIPGSYNSSTGNMTFVPSPLIYAPADSTGWHTYTTEWTSSQVKFLFDGQVVATTTQAVPKTRFYWVLQAETQTMNSTLPPSTQHGLIDLAWLTAEQVG